MYLALAAVMSVLVAAPAAAQDPIAIGIEGVSGVLLENVRAHLTLDRAPLPETEEQLRMLARASQTEVRRALEALGYFEPTIVFETERLEDRWRVRYRIDPGAPVRLREILLELDGEGRDDEALQNASDLFPLDPGEPLNQGLYEQGKQRLQDVAFDRGYFDARFTRHAIRVDLVRNEAVVDLALDTGRRYRFGSVTFQQEGFSPRFLARFLPFKRGDSYRTDLLLTLREHLADSDYFSEIDVRPLRTRAENYHVPVRVRLDPLPRHVLSTSLGYGTDTGARGRIGYDNRRVNARGHRFTSFAELSTRANSAGAIYVIPLRNPVVSRFELDAGYRDEETVSFETERTTAGARHISGRSGGWVRTLSLDLSYDAFRIGDAEPRRARLVVPGAAWNRTLVDDRLDPRRGSALQPYLRGTDHWLLSRVRFIQAGVNARLVRPAGRRGRLFWRAQLGSTLVDEFERLPPAQRFFAGGDFSIRGFAYNALGPTDTDGNVTGGRHLTTAGIEYELRLRPSWSVAVFYDAGAAFNRLQWPLDQGAGVGLRWQSPVGPVRVDFAFGISDDDRPFRLHFSMGPYL